VDNEGAGKKKSKSKSHLSKSYMVYLNPSQHFPVCCIYHKPKRFDESSDEDSSDSDADQSVDMDLTITHITIVIALTMMAPRDIAVVEGFCTSWRKIQSQMRMKLVQGRRRTRGGRL